MTRAHRAGGACGVLLLVVVLDGQAAALSAREHRTIEAVIRHVAHLTEAVFLRNNTA
jgi:hypothetical protein